MRSPCARMVQSCFYHAASPFNDLRNAQWTVLPSLRNVNVHRSFPAHKKTASTSYRLAAMPASSASTEHRSALFTNTSLSPPLPAFLSSCSDKAAASLFPIEKGDVHIWWLRHQHNQQEKRHHSSCDEATHLASTCASLLSAEEAAECGTSTDPASQELRLVARAFTRTVLSRYLGHEISPASLIFERNEHGKPELLHPTGSLRFNLTHTPGLIGVAVTNGAAVGLDTESINRKTKRNALKLAQRRFAKLEIEQLERLQGDEQAQAALFIKLWTLKEAYVKAIGKGIGAPPGLRGFSFLLLNEESSLSSKLEFEQMIDSTKTDTNWENVDPNDARSVSETSRWDFALMQPVDGHLAAVCCEKIITGKDSGSNSGSELRITSFLAETDSSTGVELMTPRILATGSSK